MSFNKNVICVRDSDKKNLTNFELDVNTVRGYLADIANTYLLVAYRVYEMDYFQSYKQKNYKNIVEACKDCLGFSKTTTYNMINIVKRFGEPDKSGYITYNSLFGVRDFKYSQLTEMLNLSDRQLKSVTPETTVKQLREMKKSPDVGKIEKKEDTPEPEFIEADFVIAENGIEEAAEADAPAPAPQDDVVSDSYTINGVTYKSSDFPYLIPLTEPEYIALRRYLNINITSKRNDFWVLSEISQTLKLAKKYTGQPKN
jgi:hypothetical protein